MDTDVVKAELDGGVLLLTLNRPDRLNAWTYEMEARYFDLLDEADENPDVRVVVLTGAGRGFCPGMDIGVISERSKGKLGPDPQPRSRLHALQLRKPLIGAINGACAGLGLIQALAADVRFAADTATFATSFTRRGLGAENGISWLLPRIIGHARALELILSGRKFGAEEADRMGVVHRVLPAADLMSFTMEYAREIAAQCSPIAMAIAKHQVYHDWDRSLADSVRFSKVWSRAPEHRYDYEEGVASFKEKRAPAFGPLPPAAKCLWL